MTGTFNDVMFEYYRAEERFTDALVDAGWGEYDRVGGDHYDNSIEFYRCTDGERICEAAQRVIFDAGFCKCWTNHNDGSEWYYSWSGKEFRYTKGSQHKSPTSPITPEIDAAPPQTPPMSTIDEAVLTAICQMGLPSYFGEGAPLEAWTKRGTAD